MLNNWAFAFDISVPMHILLRSFGSVMTLTVGWLWGKKYSAMQVGAVAALTVGVIVSAWADAAGKVYPTLQDFAGIILTASVRAQHPSPQTTSKTIPQPSSLALPSSSPRSSSRPSWASTSKRLMHATVAIGVRISSTRTFWASSHLYFSTAPSPLNCRVSGTVHVPPSPPVSWTGLYHLATPPTPHQAGGPPSRPHPHASSAKAKMPMPQHQAGHQARASSSSC